MTKVLVEDSTLLSIASAIRNKNNSSNTYKPSQMPDAIDSLTTSSIVDDYFDSEIKDGYTFLSSIKKIPAFHFNGTSCKSIFSMLKAETIDLSNFDTSNVNNMEKMFDNCTKLKILDVSNLNTSKVTNMGYMFNECNSLLNLDLSNFDTSNVNNMQSMFYKCTNLVNLDLSNLNTSNLKDVRSMFSGCSNLSTLDLSNFDTSNVVNYMNAMFSNCSNLLSLDLSSFDISKVTSLSDMFNNCTNLKNLNLSSFDMTKVDNINSTFLKCSNLENLTFGINFGKGFKQKQNNYYSYNLNVSFSPLAHESLMSIINNLYDLNLTYDVANGGALYTQRIIVGPDNLSKLTVEEIAIATAKGFSVS